MTKLVINAKIIEPGATAQIHNMKHSGCFRELISIMPDVHEGKGSVIGFTGKFDNVVIPNVVGVDIGCGVVCYNLGKIDINFEELDVYIRANIPLGFESRNSNDFLNKLSRKEDIKTCCDTIRDNFYGVEKDSKYIEPLSQIGTLGGGNHFIEIDQDDNGDKYLMVHTGSRNFGLKVANKFQKEAKTFCGLAKIVAKKDLEYLPIKYGGSDYLYWMNVAQIYASYNRQTIVELILEFFNQTFDENKYVESVHNFIGDDNIIRKGAIQAYKDQIVLIPINMAFGTIIGKGKGNPKYNFSAPHGAGRLFGRNVMKQQFNNGTHTMEEFENAMSGIYSTSVNKKTVDESPFAYKSFEDIKDYLEETVEIVKIIKPIYNLKAGD